MTHPDEGPETAEAMAAVRRALADTRATLHENERVLDALLAARGIPCTDYPIPTNEAPDAPR